MSRVFLAALLVPVIVTVSGTGIAYAQVIQNPPGAVGGLFGGHRPPDPNRTSQTLALTFDLSAGYDENVNPEPVGGPNDPPTPRLSGQASTAAGTVRYWRGRTGRSLEGNGRAFLNRQGANTGQVLGGEAGARGAALFGRRTGIDGAINVSYEPTFLFNGFGGLLAPIEGEPAPPDVTPPQGVVEQRWLATSGSGSVFRNWTTRQRMDVQVSGLRRRPVDGEGLNSRTLSTSIRHAWSVSRGASLQLSYAFDENRQGDETSPGRPLRTQSVEGGVRLERRLSPDRSLVFTTTGGVAVPRIQSAAATAVSSYVVGTVAASARLDLNRTWNLAAEGNRDVTVLEGLTPEPFTSELGGVRLAGQIGRRMGVSVAGAYSRGRALVSNTGAFESLAGTASMQYAFARCCSVFGSYSYYEHRTTDLRTLQPGFPARYDRNSARVGMSVWLPLYGTF